jgi:spore maturation protein CgeB
MNGRVLRIAYIAPRWDYGDRTRGLSFEETNFRSALEGMGHNVMPFDFIERTSVVGAEQMNVELTRFIGESEPDIAVFVLFKDEIAIETIQRITASGICTYNWFADDHWRFENFSRHYAPAFSLISTTDRDAVAKYRSLGVQHVVLTQWACNRYLYDRRDVPLRYDVTFVGQRYGDRPKVFNALRRSGLDVRCWGYGWDDGRLTLDEMVDVFNASRININLGAAWAGRLWRRRRTVSQIKARPFEVAGSGGFVLADRAPHIEEYFDPECEISLFRDDGDLIARAHEWLEREDERAAVARRGYERVRAEHTYDHRFVEIFKEAELVGG